MNYLFILFLLALATPVQAGNSPIMYIKDAVCVEAKSNAQAVQKLRKNQENAQSVFIYSKPRATKTEIDQDLYNLANPENLDRTAFQKIPSSNWRCTTQTSPTSDNKPVYTTAVVQSPSQPQAPMYVYIPQAQISPQPSIQNYNYTTIQASYPTPAPVVYTTASVQSSPTPVYVATPFPTTLPTSQTDYQYNKGTNSSGTNAGNPVAASSPNYVDSLPRTGSEVWLALAALPLAYSGLIFKKRAEYNRKISQIDIV